MAKTGVWLIGARGGLSTTVVVGTLSSVRGLTTPTGLFTESPEAKGLDLPALDELVFGGHEIRDQALFDSALEIYRETGVLRHDHLLELEEAIRSVDEEIRPGTAYQCGESIVRFARATIEQTRPRAIVDRIREDLRAFRERHRLDGVVVVNLSSTEPSVPDTRASGDSEALEEALDAARCEALRASSLYAYAAFAEGCPFVNFTPSPGSVLLSLRALADRAGLPYMGSDGKTGETLVKSALAPMFRYRNLRVLSWQGYNILGDRDGEVLADPENKASKVKCKDEAIPAILGYPLHTHVGIDYVPSLHDQKTAWDFIHFRGFLDVKMSLQFIWQGFDSVLAAPVVLDLVRFAELARRRGESGPMRHLSSYFKSPLDVPDHDLHFQIHSLLDYVERCRAGGHGTRDDGAREATRG